MFQQFPRIGFNCKFQESRGVADSKLNTKSTTIAWLSKQTKDVAYKRLYALAQTNIQIFKQQLLQISKLPHTQRMFRISSDFLTAYTHEDYMWCYQELEMQLMLERGFKECGDLARLHDIRLSFHPGQFCVLASDNPQTIENSVYEFEYHVDLARWMGFAKEFQDFKINVHIGGKRGPQGIIDVLSKLSREARNCLTIENAEFSWGLEPSLELVEHCALVLDVHHHWIMSGEYIYPDDTRFKQVVDSWRGVRPVIHYAVSREEHLPTHSKLDKPDLKALLASGLTKSKLRAHSDFYWNQACNQWVKDFIPYADIMCEAKEKNLAHSALCKEILT